MEKRYRGFENAWWIALGFFVSMIVIQMAVMALIPNKIMDRWGEVICQVFEILPCAAGVIILKKTYPQVSVKNSLSFHKFNPVIIPLLILLPYCAQNFAQIVFLPLESITSQLFGSYDPGFDKNASAEVVWTTLISAVVLAPLIEEILFRGVIMKLMERYGLWTAVIFSSLIFALMHMDPTSFVVIFILGMVFALVKYVTGSLWTTIIMHAANNAIGYFQYIYSDKISDNAYMLIFVITAVLAPVMFMCIMRICRGKWKWWQGLVWRNIFRHKISVAMILFIAIYAGEAAGRFAYNNYDPYDYQAPFSQQYGNGGYSGGSDFLPYGIPYGGEGLPYGNNDGTELFPYGGGGFKTAPEQKGDKS